MASYISSTNNRFYVVSESSYGTAPAIQATQRIPAVRLKATQSREAVKRLDKTGSRTFLGWPAGLRRPSLFDLSTYMTAWSNQSQPPGHGPLVEAAMGAPVQSFAGGTVATASGTQIGFAAPHGLSPGQAVECNGEIRFVASVIDGSSVQLNAPFTTTVGSGAAVGPTATYTVSGSLASASIFDYWSPATAVQRVLCGAAVNQMKVQVNGDFHQFQFVGSCADIVDSSSFAAGQAGMQQYPAEPALSDFDYTIIPGHLGQAWIGSAPNQFFTLSSAAFQLKNNLALRDHEFGSTLSLGIVPGNREVSIDLNVFAQDDAQTTALYQASRQSSPVGVMIQLGQQQHELFGIYMPAVTPEFPQYDDTETRLQWSLKNCRAQGSSDDEVFVAFA
jgi:hypothetical protein